MTLITDEKSNTSLIKICYQRSQDVGVRNKVSLTVTVRKTPDDEQIVCTNVNMCDIRNRLESLEQTVFDLMKKKNPPVLKKLPLFNIFNQSVQTF